MEKEVPLSAAMDRFNRKLAREDERLCDPFAAPRAPIEAQSARPRSPPDARMLRMALVLGAAFGLGVGCVESLQFGFALRRFGGLEYVPRVVVLSLLRVVGPFIALSATCCAAVFVFHRAGADAPISGRSRTGILVAGTVLFLFPLATLLGTLGSALVHLAVYAQSTSAFVGAVGETIRWSDVGAGAALTAAYAVGAGIGVPLLAPRMGRSRFHVVLKLAAVFVVLALVHLVEGIVRASLSR